MSQMLAGEQGGGFAFQHVGGDQVTSVNGGTVAVKLADGKTHTVKQGDFYVLN